MRISYGRKRATDRCFAVADGRGGAFWVCGSKPPSRGLQATLRGLNDAALRVLGKNLNGVLADARVTEK